MDTLESFHGFRELALFAGAGGGILGTHLLGGRTVCAVEREPYPQAVLCARQNDGLLEPFPIWDDVCTFDGLPWRGIVDVVSGGFPCQDISVAGKRAGIGGARSGLWGEFARIIGEVRPRYAFIENSPRLLICGLDRVLCDLAALGYDAEWTCLSASDVGANHERNRIWILARKVSNPTTVGLEGKGPELSPTGFTGDGEDVPDSPRPGRCNMLGGAIPSGRSHVCDRAWPDKAENVSDSDGLGRSAMECEDGGRTSGEGPLRPPRECALDSGEPGWWSFEPNVGRVADGVAARVDRLKAIGSGQVPLVAATAFLLLLQRFLNRKAPS